MKTLRYLIALSGFILMLGMIACEPISETEKEVNTITELADTEPEVVGSIACADSCLFKGVYEISDYCASCMMNNFKGNRAQFLRANKQLRGFEIKHQELLDILAQIQEDSTASVYAMLAIKNVIVNNKLVNEPEIVFQVQQNVTAENGAVSTENTYYDFTAPCPTYCPDL